MFDEYRTCSCQLLSKAFSGWFEEMNDDVLITRLYRRDKSIGTTHGRRTRSGLFDLAESTELSEIFLMNRRPLPYSCNQVTPRR